MAPSALMTAERTRSNVVATTAEATRSDYSQYLTPYQTAKLAASMFSDVESDRMLRCLDLGAGTGILSVALAERYGGRMGVDCIELDPELAAICDDELARLEVRHRVVVGDALMAPIEPGYDRVILNPPYRKMAAGDVRQAGLPARSPNLYSAFMMVALWALAPGGECVAIVPRSWTNGQYFQQFRAWALSKCSLDAMHVYGSRTEIFADTNVLQETMLVRFSKRPQSPTVRVSESQVKDGEPVVHEYAFDELVDVEGDLTVRMTPAERGPLDGMATLKASGLCASTGKVVDFRSREVLRREFEPGLNRLIYARNFTAEGFEHPVDGYKPQWIDCSSEKFAKQLIPAGSYVVVKRFSSKEETRRVKAHVLDLDEPQALENHLNYVHAGTPRRTAPLDPALARGLALWLSSTEVDAWFRARSGSTQVNASDLNAMPVPSADQLVELGGRWSLGLSQEEVDGLCLSVLP
ncbi:methyltransferase [Collinsella provencensis]|uniref:methyltransferase n=1 Tax=Collinsella provencensis TaxID=1937461 RepID=UPI000C828FEB|nr:methyltransferase [Collinsella provencensis]